jgi:hypothetical protein
MNMVKKQLIDQTAHIFMNVGSVCLVGTGMVFALRGRIGIAVLLSTVTGVLVTSAWNAVRELIQWPPRETTPWDAPLDWAFEVLGILGGAALFYMLLGPWLARL